LATQLHGHPHLRPRIWIGISDNASTDNTQAVCQTFLQDQIINAYHRNETNLGIRKNVLLAYTLCPGAYKWVLGDDELLDRLSLVNLMNALQREKPGLVIAIPSPYGRPLPKPGLYPQYRDFAQETLRLQNPHALVLHTLCSSNIVRADCYDPNWAEANIEGYFGQMFGILRPLLNQHAPVLLPEFPLIALRELAPGASPADGVWADLDLCWQNYLVWLRHEMKLDELDPKAPSRMERQRMLKELHKHPLSFLRNRWKALFQPSAYRFVLSRLFRS
jgi:glycosyltransferase involved in cell wall biosynthesis